MIRTLLVEPCAATRAALAETLARCGCDVTTAEHGEEAYRSHLAGEYALAVLGVDRMPDQGFWLCRRLRSLGRRADPVILALSDRWDAGRMAWLLEAGIDDWTTLPPDEAWLAERVDMARRRAGLSQPVQKGSAERVGVSDETGVRPEETREELAAICEAMICGLVVAESPSGRALRTNQAMCRITGYSEAELLGMSVVDLCAASHQEQMRRSLAAAGERGESQSAERLLSRKDGSIVPYQVSSSRIEYQGRSATVSFFRDLSDRKHTEAVLASSEARFRALFDGAAMGIVLCDRESRVIECNATFADMIGYDCEAILGSAMARFTHPDDRAEGARKVRDFLDGERESLDFEKRLIHRDGTAVWCRMTLSYLPEPGGRRDHVIGVIENITDRKIAQQSLRESERMLRGLVENLPDLIIVAAADWTIQFVNRGLSGAPPKQAVGQSVLSLVPPESQRRLVELRQRLVEMREVQTAEIVDVAGIWWAVQMIPFEENGDDPGMLLIGTDVTGQKSAAEAVQKEQEALRKMLELLERDRELIAFEIHDGFSQQLTGALFNFEAAGQSQHRTSAEVNKSFQMGLQLLRESIAEARRLVRGLRPPVLDAFGIVPAIEHLIEDHHAAGGSRVEFTTAGLAGRLAHPLESALFRTVQETLNNARKYSRSDRIRIHLSQDARHVCVEIQDWGVGFDPAKVGDDHFGLRGIRERARLLGGNVYIESRPGGGTRIRVELPWVERVIPPAEQESEKSAD